MANFSTQRAILGHCKKESLNKYVQSFGHQCGLWKRMTALILALGHGSGLVVIPFLPGILYVYEKVAHTDVEAPVQT